MQFQASRPGRTGAFKSYLVYNFYATRHTGNIVSGEYRRPALFFFFVVLETSFLFSGLCTGIVCFHSCTRSFNKDVWSAYSESGTGSAGHTAKIRTELTA